MKLIQVIYELYQTDMPLRRGHNGDLHAINRELRLCFTDHPSIWVSWSSTPREFCVDYNLQPHFRGQIEIISEMTASNLWNRFIHQEIEFHFREPEHQLLEMNHGSDSLWFWAEGEFGSDVLHISSKPLVKGLKRSPESGNDQNTTQA